MSVIIRAPSPRDPAIPQSPLLLLNIINRLDFDPFNDIQNPPL